MTTLRTAIAARGGTSPETPSAIPLDIRSEPRWLEVTLPQRHRFVSWAIVGGGMREGRRVVWHQVDESELRPPMQADRLLRERLENRNRLDAVGLLTSRCVERYADVTAEVGPVSARCVATVGLGNALRVGDLPGASGRVGTINLLCVVSRPLSPEALLEGLSIATEARTAAILSARVSSRRSGEWATGTGTDCIVMAAPARRAGATYAGKHTALGSVIGQAVEQAVSAGARAWLDEHALRTAERP